MQGLADLLAAVARLVQGPLGMRRCAVRPDAEGRSRRHLRQPPTSCLPWTSGSRTTTGRSARPSASTSGPRSASPCRAWARSWAPSSSPLWQTFPDTATPAAWPRMRVWSRYPATPATTPAPTLQSPPTLVVLHVRAVRDDAIGSIPGLLPQEASRGAESYSGATRSHPAAGSTCSGDAVGQETLQSRPTGHADGLTRSLRLHSTRA